MFSFRRPFPTDEDEEEHCPPSDPLNWNNHFTDHRQKRARRSKQQTNEEENSNQTREDEAADKLREEIEQNEQRLNTIIQDVEVWRTMAEEQEIVLERARNRIRDIGPLFEKTVESGRTRLSRRSHRLSSIIENIINEIGKDQTTLEDQDNRSANRNFTVAASGDKQSKLEEGSIIKSRKHGHAPFLDTSIPSLHALLVEAKKRLQAVNKLTDETIYGNWSTGKGELQQSGLTSNNPNQLLLQASYSEPTNDRDFIAAIKRLAAPNSSNMIATGMNSYSTESTGSFFPGQIWMTENIMLPNSSWLTEVFNALKIGCNDIGQMPTKGDKFDDNMEGKDEGRVRIMRELQQVHLRRSILVRRVEQLKRRLEEVDPMSGSSCNN